jgi:carbamoyltransferase
LQYFDYCTGLTMTNGRFDALFGGKPRDASERLDQRHMDLAASVQQVTEEIVLRLTRSLAREGQSENLCLAGAVALNCVANGKVLRERNSRIYGHSLRRPMPAARWARRAGGILPICRQATSGVSGRCHGRRLSRTMLRAG